MTQPHRHLQLHLFDVNPDRLVLSPQIRKRLLTLIVALLDEAASDDVPAQTPLSEMEAGNE